MLQNFVHELDNHMLCASAFLVSILGWINLWPNILEYPILHQSFEHKAELAG